MCITKITSYTTKSQLKNYFIHYYIETLLPRDIFLMFFSFCFFSSDILWYLFHILFFYFFLHQISFLIYLWLALLIFLYHFHNNLFLYLVSYLCFFDNKSNQWSCIHILSTKLQPIIMLIASSLLIYQKSIL